MVLLLASEYAFDVFLAAAEIVMILRVYAMYNRSKTILGLLLVFYVATIVLYAISSSIYNNPNTNLSSTHRPFLWKKRTSHLSPQ